MTSPAREITCIDCGGRAHLISYEPEDGRWEAWLVDESGLPPHRVQDRRELAQFLEQACRSARSSVTRSRRRSPLYSR